MFYFIYIIVHFTLFIFTIICKCFLTTVIRLQWSFLFSSLSAVALKLLCCVVNVGCMIWIFVSYFSFCWSVICDVTVCWWWTCSIHTPIKFKPSTPCTSQIFTRHNDKNFLNKLFYNLTTQNSNLIIIMHHDKLWLTRMYSLFTHLFWHTKLQFFLMSMRLTIQGK